jgi:hypothetical protein
MEHIKSYQRTMDSVRLPLQHLIETGFWNPCIVPYGGEASIGDNSLRPAAREIAKELKRPFIRCYAHITDRIWDNASRQYVSLPGPVFGEGYVEVPKRKYLMPLVAPLLLAANEVTYRYRHDTTKPVYNISCNSLWQFTVCNETFWNEYYEFVLNDPVCRKARKLPSR